MKVVLTGANGYIGQNIKQTLQLKGFEVIAIDRTLLYGHHLKLAKELANTHTVINLAGAPILKRWTKKIRQSYIIAEFQPHETFARL